MIIPMPILGECKVNFKIEDVRGGGGGQGFGTPEDEGGGSKSGQILRTSFMYGP